MMKSIDNVSQLKIDLNLLINSDSMSTPAIVSKLEEIIRTSKRKGVDIHQIDLLCEKEDQPKPPDQKISGTGWPENQNAVKSETPKFSEELQKITPQASTLVFDVLHLIQTAVKKRAKKDLKNDRDVMFECIGVCLKEGLSPYTVPPGSSRNILHLMASEDFNESQVSAIIKWGVPMDASIDLQKTALLLACKNKHYGMARAVLLIC